MSRIALLIAVVLAITVGAGSAGAADIGRLASRLWVDTGAPGVAIGVYDRGTITIGVAGTRTHDTDVAVDIVDLWHIGSNTKSMTATVAARLVEQGRLSWDDTIGAVLGDVVPDMNPAYRDLTLVHLFSHRSGLPANIGRLATLRYIGTDADRDAVVDRRRYAGRVLTLAPVATPQTGFLYSNAGYVVAAAMMEARTGVSWEDLMRGELFAPLGLASAGFGPPGTPGTLDQPRGHRAGLLGGLRSVEPGAGADNPPVLGPAGRVHMTVTDQLRYAAVHMRGIRGDEGGFLTRESWHRLHTPPFGGDYALGWVVTDDGVYRHAGSNTMWLVQMYLWPDADRALVVAANDGRIEDLRAAFNAIGETLAPDPDP
ncbi:MAG: serine hydrolase domain-containing protein [Inquilinaceae bacterium]